MLGEQIGEAKGKRTGQRVLNVEEGLAKIETSFSESGKFKGVDFTNIGTFWTITRPGGTQYGEGRGVITSKSGDEMATWTGYGVGGFTGLGRIRYHGSFFYRTNSIAKLSFLNNLVGLFEYEWDEDGNSSAKVWEWK
jgi:hypothetical protein